MRNYLTAFVMLLLCISAFPDDAPARAPLLGTWQQLDDSGKAASIWILEAKGSSLHITHSQGDQKLSECQCAPTGADCDGTASGQKAKITLYYIGATLVQFETAGSDVTKRQFSVVDQADTMELEVTAVTGGGKPETLHLKRAPR